MELLTSVPVGNGKVKLQIESKGDYYNFSYAENGGEFKLLKDHLDARFLSTKTAGGFTGCLYGLYATSSGKESTNKASFGYLRYKGDDPVYR